MHEMYGEDCTVVFYCRESLLYSHHVLPNERMSTRFFAALLYLIRMRGVLDMTEECERSINVSLMHTTFLQSLAAATLRAC